MFKLVGMIVIFMFIFKIGRRMSPKVKDTTDKVLSKSKEKIKEFGNKRYYFETVTDENGVKKRQVRAIEEIDREEYLNLKSEVE